MLLFGVSSTVVICSGLMYIMVLCIVSLLFFIMALRLPRVVVVVSRVFISFCVLQLQALEKKQQ